MPFSKVEILDFYCDNEWVSGTFDTFKGQLISKGLFVAIVSTKKTFKRVQIKELYYITILNNP